jgi:hypothetical protein
LASGVSRGVTYHRLWRLSPWLTLIFMQKSAKIAEDQSGWYSP